ncbi:hypothetical protein A2410_01390 [Candidatus Shapirobacteria bacterium RIFOXYC1_FULL_38_24]|uniref:Uncharacterized protein n=2 Tax=Candidatus Shapironibacteriota TaxID=1752721 RepID=A0A0G0M920_9BACT|nr:MAG: hypothetical protein US90_C0008G0041 [Candidatus Shapirobacteria bacterium GW2011_GWE2_38_30]KKQ89358.1 MAG: hypothetical protein UT14_C0060G0002 [Candidatus Shapirobacteria bacterium GW2011_GWE1_38_92]OGL56565.1 MAG: hypothetical protein A2195_00660 [Candidatus Shapirobacteria bacterium RIFOXYA1_FULL_39_17]OGL56678.1 MAG: hypothetical protein A2410_01390 [Candidatus Shapirobacteria bacterium RIFOXYC1_FULL_38_24]HAP37553.1 hypothetical protein [Candidatus Shapirobacteria bacterium]
MVNKLDHEPQSNNQESKRGFVLTIVCSRYRHPNGHLKVEAVNFEKAVEEAELDLLNDRLCKEHYCGSPLIVHRSNSRL